VGDVIIEDSPGLKVALIGRAGSIKQCIVKNSPGAVVSDTSTAIGKSGAVISDGEDAVSEIATEPPAKAVATLATRPARPAPSGAPAKLEAVVDRDGKTVHASLSGELGEDVAYVTFEAVDRFDYLLGAPVLVTEKPWKTDLKPGKRGPITIRATITRNGGDADKAIVGVVQVQ